MPSNSFRLFAVSLHDGRMRERQLFESAKPRVYRVESSDGTKSTVKPDPVDYLEEIVEAIDGHGVTPFAYGKKIAEDDDMPGVVIGHVIRWQEANSAARHGALTRFWFEAGPTTDDGIVVDLDGGADIDLAGKATLHPYRAALITGTGMQFAILAVEVRGRSCPKDQLVRALRDSTGQPWRLKISHGVAGKAAVLQFVDRAEVGAVTFIEHGFATDGSKKAPQRKQLRVDEFVGGAKEVLKALRGWVEKDGTNLTAAAAMEIKKIVVTEEVEIPFTDVAIELIDGKVQRTYRPNSDFQRFAYLLGGDIVDDEDFFASAEQAALGLLEDVQAIAQQADDEGEAEG
jgi:hypothetical protein